MENEEINGILNDMNFKVDLQKHLPLTLGALIIVLLGVLTGWYFSDYKKAPSLASNPNAIKVTDKEAGMVDESKYTGEIPEGTLLEGGIGDEGSFHLEREGGKARNVYLTSSVIDLQSFVGKKVKVWGETLSSKKAGWLMDVAKIKVIE